MLWVKTYTHRGWIIESMPERNKHGRKTWLIYDSKSRGAEEPLTANTLKEAREIIDSKVLSPMKRMKRMMANAVGTLSDYTAAEIMEVL